VFDIGWSEMAIIMLVALVVIGPKDLPRLARTLGQWVAKGRAMAREFQRSLEDMAREAELDDVKREIEKVGRTNIRQSIEKTIDPTGDLGHAFDPNSNNKASAKALDSSFAGGSSANGEAKKPVTTKAEPPAASKPEPRPAAELEASSDKASAQPETPAKPATKRKPRASTKPKTADKPRAKAKSKAASDSAPNKPATSESPEAETVAEPG
jgi:sec-independent protein translocase protein TatB